MTKTNRDIIFYSYDFPAICREMEFHLEVMHTFKIGKNIYGAANATITKPEKFANQTVRLYFINGFVKWIERNNSDHPVKYFSQDRRV